MSTVWFGKRKRPYVAAAAPKLERERTPTARQGGSVAGRDLHHNSGEAPEQDRVPESRADMHTTVRSVALPEQALGG